MLTFKQFCESRDKYLEQNPANGFYELHDTVVPIYTRDYKFFVMDKKTNDMVEVTADKIVHPPQADSAMSQSPVKSARGTAKTS